MSLTVLIIAFLVALAFVLVTIIKYNIHPFVSLLFGAIIMGLCSGMPLPDIAKGMASGFGGTMGGIGILIILGVILGEMLHRSGCTSQIAALLLSMTGKKNAPTAINITGYIVSIPVFFDAAFVILVQLVKSLSREGKIPFVQLVCALAVGLITTHAMVIPTPGPVAVAGNMGINMGAFLLYSIIISIPASIFGGIVYGKFLGSRDEYKNDFANAFADEKISDDITEMRTDLPSGQLGIGLILLPIVVILIGTVVTMFTEPGTTLNTVFAFLGDKNIALLIGVMVALPCLKKYMKDDFNEIVTEATTQSGAILAITGAGGAFGQIITNSGIGASLADGMTSAVAGTGVIIIVMAYLISIILRAAQGSTTVALVTTSAIFAGMMSSFPGVSPVLVAIAICAGGIGLSLPNDSGFWVINRFGKFTVKDTIRIYTYGGTIASVTALIVTVLISLVGGSLPGLF